MKTILSVLALVLMVTTMSTKAEAAQCTVDLVNGRGMTLETFRGFGYDRIDACQEAKIDCRRVKRSGYYRARILTCEARRAHHNRRMVQRSCRAEMTGPRGHRVFQTFFGQARGPRGSGVKAQACQRALRQCRQAKRRSGRVRAVCTAANGTGGGYSTPRHPRRYPVPAPPRRGERRGNGRRGL